MLLFCHVSITIYATDGYTRCCCYCFVLFDRLLVFGLFLSPLFILLCLILLLFGCCCWWCFSFFLGPDVGEGGVYRHCGDCMPLSFLRAALASSSLPRWSYTELYSAAVASSSLPRWSYTEFYSAAFASSFLWNVYRPTVCDHKKIMVQQAVEQSQHPLMNPQPLMEK